MPRSRAYATTSAVPPYPRAISPIQDVLDELAGEPLTVCEIWTTVTDQRGSDASYAAVRDYIRTRRLTAQISGSPSP
jgi:hypothetical protein